MLTIIKKKNKSHYNTVPRQIYIGHFPMSLKVNVIIIKFLLNLKIRKLLLYIYIYILLFLLIVLICHCDNNIIINKNIYL